MLDLKTILRLLLPLLFLSACNTVQKEDAGKVDYPVTDSVELWLKEVDQKKRSNGERLNILTSKVQNSASRLKGSQKSGYYSDLSTAFLARQDTALFRSLNARSYILAQADNDSILMAKQHSNLGIYFDATKARDSAFYYFFKAEKLYADLGDEFSSAGMLFKMAQIQAQIGDYISSEIALTMAIEKYHLLNDYNNLFYCYKLLGIVAGDLKEYDRAISHYNEAFDFFRKSDLDEYEEKVLINNIGIIYQNQGLDSQALTYLSKVLAFDTVKSIKPILLARVLSNYSASQIKLGETNKVLQNLKRAIQIQDEIEDSYGKSASLYHLGEYYLEIKDTVNALESFRHSKMLAKKIDNNDRYLKTLLKLTQLDTENALDYTTEYIALSDSLQVQERKIRDKFARIRYETNEVVAENQALARQRLLWVGIAAGVLLLGIAAIVIVSQRIRNQKLKFQQEQQATNQEIFNLLLLQGEKLEEGKKIEQKRISEELHDGVQGRLQGARMMLLGLNKRHDQHAIEERSRAIVMLKDIQDEVRAISHELSHAAYQKMHNFIVSLTDLVKTIENTSEINIGFNYSNELDWDSLKGDLKINLYRMIQEILQNSLKHSQCTAIEINLMADEKSINATINDNGQGFLVRKGKKGIGMRNIASRMRKVKGTWDIDSKLGEGTKVTLIIPIEPNCENA